MPRKILHVRVTAIPWLGWREQMGEEMVVIGGRRRNPDVFTVIGDPTKRKILEMTREREWCVNELVESLEISQPAISKHLRSLREAGLVEVRVDGQRRWYRLKSDRMEPLQSWVKGFSRNGANSTTPELEVALN